MWPAPLSFDPAVSQAVAIKGAIAAGFEHTASATSALFALMSDTTMATIEPDGTATEPLYAGAPVWVLETRHVPVDLGAACVVAQGGAHSSGCAPSPVRVAISTCFTFVNAMSGKYEFASCTGKQERTLNDRRRGGGRPRDARHPRV